MSGYGKDGGAVDRTRRRVLGLWAVWPALAAAAPAGRPIRVTFINPGISNPQDPTGGYWLSVSAAMRAAAEQLNIELEILYAERDHVLMVQQARDVALRRVLPDYLVVVNEKRAAEEMVRVANQAGLKVFVAFNTFVGEQLAALGAPRERLPHWIGSLVPDNVLGGYLAARAIIDRAQEVGKVRLLAISGDLPTQASAERMQGLQQAIAELPGSDLLQSFVGQWRQDIAEQLAAKALRRYPEVNAIWAANDPMALGALAAATAAQRRPGRDLFISGLGWAPSALEKVKEGTLVASIGGLHLTGAMALVLLHDYHRGRDFSDEGLAMKRGLFAALDRSNVESYLARYGDGNWGKIDFTRLSRVLNPAQKRYEFGIQAVLGR